MTGGCGGQELELQKGGCVSMRDAAPLLLDVCPPSSAGRSRGGQHQPLPSEIPSTLLRYTRNSPFLGWTLRNSTGKPPASTCGRWFTQAPGSGLDAQCQPSRGGRALRSETTCSPTHRVQMPREGRLPSPGGSASSTHSETCFHVSFTH